MEKTIDYYMSLAYRMEFIEDKDEGGYVVSFPELKGCITCGDTLEKAYDNAMDAKREWITALKNVLSYIVTLKCQIWTELVK